VKVVDANLLLYAVDQRSPRHTPARRWLAQPCAVIVHPGDRHAAMVRQLLSPLGTAGNLVNDAHLAALAIEHGAELDSCDSDFSRFSGLRWINPLDSQ
jgi:predicted nucleic acid-binding protein